MEWDMTKNYKETLKLSISGGKILKTMTMIPTLKKRVKYKHFIKDNLKINE
jgi:hypothetical protein